MRAVRYYGARDLRFEDIPPPAPPVGRQVLIKPLFVGICGTDLHEYAHGPVVTSKSAHPYTGASLPQIMGHEFSGEVVAIGEAVTNVAVGDQVSVMPLVMPMDDFYSRRGMHNGSPRMATIGLQSEWGGLGELALLNDYNVFTMPDGMNVRDGALIEPSAVALNGAERAYVHGGSSVFIAGGGPIGALAVLASAALGASRIFVSEPNPTRRAQIHGLGVGTVVLDPTASEVGDAIRDLTEGSVGVDSAIECSGTEAGLKSCLDAVRNFGAIAVVGIHTKATSLNPTIIASKSITISGSWGFPITSWPKLLAMVECGRYPVAKIVTSEIGIDEIVPKGFSKLMEPNNSEMKIVVRVQ